MGETDAVITGSKQSRCGIMDVCNTYEGSRPKLLPRPESLKWYQAKKVAYPAQTAIRMPMSALCVVLAVCKC